MLIRFKNKKQLWKNARILCNYNISHSCIPTDLIMEIDDFNVLKIKEIPFDARLSLHPQIFKAQNIAINNKWRNKP